MNTPISQITPIAQNAADLGRREAELLPIDAAEAVEHGVAALDEAAGEHERKNVGPLQKRAVPASMPAAPHRRAPALPAASPAGVKATAVAATSALTMNQ